MEERRVAAWVLGITGLIIIFFTVILPEIRYRSTQNISFKNCSVFFKYKEPDLASDVYRAAQNKLGLCLCKAYKQNSDAAVKERILQIYRQYGNRDSLISNNVDTIIKYKYKVLDTLILVD